jgi:predicted nuclease of predicted toxin-antitoxin system
MRFLLDQDVYAATARFLRQLGHDVVTASDKGCATATDRQLLLLAGSERRILVTRDRDYGNLVFVEKRGAGVLYLRTRSASSLAELHGELSMVLAAHTEAELAHAFVVVEPGRYRLRRVVR